MHILLVLLFYSQSRFKISRVPREKATRSVAPFDQRYIFLTHGILFVQKDFNTNDVAPKGTFLHKKVVESAISKLTVHERTKYINFAYITKNGFNF